MVSKVISIGLNGLDGFITEIETDCRREESTDIEIVGLPDTAIKEAKERVKSALYNSGFIISDKKTVINLAPANIRKEGPSFDLAMVIGILASMGTISKISEDTAFIGEISLSGKIRPCSGILAMVISAKALGIKNIFIPRANINESKSVRGINIYGAGHIDEILSHFNGQYRIECINNSGSENPLTEYSNISDDFNFCDIVGQQSGKRACEIAAAGGHNLLLIGPPGTGKSLLAKSIPSILPKMSFDEIIECSKIYSVAGKLNESNPLITSRPFIKTNQSISVPGMTGGGTNPLPGLVSLAHNGVLFLDEIAEFSSKVLDSLRQPIEDQTVTISRVKRTVTYPCSFMLVGAMNPCPCGNYGHPSLRCSCTKAQVDKYFSKLSGPFMDRLDIQTEIPPVRPEDIKVQTVGENSKDIRKRVDAARKIQAERFKNTGIRCNAKMTPHIIKELSRKMLTEDANNLLDSLFTKMSMSMRAYDKIVKIAQTIADLEGTDSINPSHIAEAAFFRTLDKKYRQR